jgi:hypothetical protein
MLKLAQLMKKYQKIYEARKLREPERLDTINTKRGFK